MTPLSKLALLPSPILTLTRLSEALRYCHDEAIPSFQLLHRDIKPDNVGFRADGSLVRHPLTQPLALNPDPSPDYNP